VFELFVGGLKGGHSGADIHLGRANANKVLGRVLSEIKTPFYLSSVEGGNKDNAIPREAFAVICAKGDDREALEREIALIETDLKAELETFEPSLFVRVTEIKGSFTDFVFDSDSEKAIVRLLLDLPFGVYRFSEELEGVVETSNNVGVVKVGDGEVIFSCSVRSLAASRKEEMCNKIVAVGEALGAECEVSGGYPGWEYNPVSPLREVFKKVYLERYGKEAAVTSIHAGLECGIFADKMLGIDMISIGPDLFDLHTPDERACIASVERVYGYLIEVLGRL
jgi:dipeptidase D